MEAVLIVGIIFAFVVIVIWLDTRKRERMLLLQQGKDPNLADSKNKTLSSTNYMKWGIIILGVGLGMLAGTIIGQLLPDRYNGVYIACLMIFSGLSVIVSFLVTRHVAPADKPAEGNGE